MLSKQALLSILCLAMLASCSDGTGTNSNTGKTDSPAHHINNLLDDPGDGRVFIPADSANKMIKSYLTSINSLHNDSDLRSIIFDADSLRAYLSNTSIKHVKVMFAHKLDYINAQGSGHNVGYKSGALTVVFGGYDANGNYIFWSENRVPNLGTPCPSSCVTTGTASDDLFPVNH